MNTALSIFDQIDSAGNPTIPTVDNPTIPTADNPITPTATQRLYTPTADNPTADNPITPTATQRIYTPAGEYTIYITKSGAFIHFKYIYCAIQDVKRFIKYIRKIENYFTLKSIQLTGHTKQIKRCKVYKKNKLIVVPRFGVFEILNNKFHLSNFHVISQINFGEAPSKPFNWIAKLTPNQRIISSYILTNIYTKARVNAGSAGCILNLEAGQGKSYLAAYLISRINKKTAIIIHSTSLMEQWKSVLYACYGNDVSIGSYYSKQKKLGDITLIIINSATSSEFTITTGKRKTKKIKIFNPIEYFDQFGFIIYDETHLYANNFAGQAFKVAQAPYMLGLSATPNEHPDKFDKLVWWEIGPVLNATEIPGYHSTKNEFTGEVHRIMYYGKAKYTKLIKNKVTDMVSVTETISMICKDADRVNVIIYCIKECLKKKLCTFVFADRRNYLEKLRLSLQSCNIINNSSIDILTNESDYIRIVGGASDLDLANAEAKAKVIFTTYQYMGTGKSVTRSNALILATPRKSKMKQYIKRIFRLGSDASITRHIYDICDMKICLKNQYSYRKKYYVSQNFKITSEKFTSPVNIAELINKPNNKPNNKPDNKTDNKTDNKSDNKRQNKLIEQIRNKLSS